MRRSRRITTADKILRSGKILDCVLEAKLRRILKRAIKQQAEVRRLLAENEERKKV